MVEIVVEHGEGFLLFGVQTQKGVLKYDIAIHEFVRIITWKVLLKVLLGMVELIFLIWRLRGVRAFLGVLLVSFIGLGLIITLSSLPSFFFLFLIICSTDPSIRSVSLSFIYY